MDKNKTQRPIYGGYTQPEILKNVYQIGNVDELYWFMEFVNAGGGNESANAVLTADIVVNESLDGTPREWFPIGYYYDRDGDRITENVQYKGIFDGQHHTIRGLYFNNSNQICVGLFGYNKGKITNIGIEGGSVTGGDFVGGVCGQNDGGTITGCTNSANVIGKNLVGGVCGSNFAGGTISNCYNTGEVTGTGNYNVGGVCGYNYTDDTIENCYSTGNVTGEDCVSGVCGMNYGTITNCYNTGNVTGDSDVGGVCGENYGTIENCYSTGFVERTSDSVYVGSVCGWNIGSIKEDIIKNDNMHYNASLVTYDDSEKIFSCSVNKSNISAATFTAIEMFLKNNYTKLFLEPGYHCNVLNHEHALVSLKNGYISIIGTNYFENSDDVREISPRMIITNFMQDLNYKRIVLEIFHLNYDDIETLATKLKIDRIKHLRELKEANYIAIEDGNLLGFKFMKEIYLSTGNEEDIFVCPLYHDDEGFYIEDGSIINISRDAIIDNKGTIRSH